MQFAYRNPIVCTTWIQRCTRSTPKSDLVKTWVVFVLCTMIRKTWTSFVTKMVARYASYLPRIRAFWVRCLWHSVSVPSFSFGMMYVLSWPERWCWPAPWIRVWISHVYVGNWNVWWRSCRTKDGRLGISRKRSLVFDRVSASQRQTAEMLACFTNGRQALTVPKARTRLGELLGVRVWGFECGFWV
jgi:hypothetical protein